MLGSRDCCYLFSFECQKAINMASQWDVHSARPFGLARNATKVWWLSNLLKKGPWQSHGFTPGPQSLPEEATPKRPPAPSDLNSDKAHWWHHRLPLFKKKTSQWSSLISMCSVAGSENNNALSLSHWLSYLVETTKPQAAAKLNNSQKEDGHSITIRGSLFCILPMPRGSQAVISAKDVWKFKLLEKSAESLWRFQIEECGQRWLWVKVDQGKWKWIKSCFFPFLFFGQRMSAGLLKGQGTYIRASKNEWSALFLISHWRAQTNSPLLFQIGNVFCDRSFTFDIIIIDHFMEQKYSLGHPRVPSTPGSMHTQIGLWVQAGTCGISSQETHTGRHIHTERLLALLQSSVQGFWLV